MLSAYRVCVRVSVCCEYACIGVSRCTASHTQHILSCAAQHFALSSLCLSLSQTLCGLIELTIVGATQETHSLVQLLTQRSSNKNKKKTATYLVKKFAMRVFNCGDCGRERKPLIALISYFSFLNKTQRRRKN